MRSEKEKYIKHEILKRLQRALKSLVRDSTTYRWIGDGTWSAGGCRVLAEAILRTVGGSLWVVSSPRNNIEHFLVRIDSYFIDADGLQSGGDILEKMERMEYVPSPFLREYHPRLDSGEIFSSETSVQYISIYLREKMES